MFVKTKPTLAAIAAFTLLSAAPLALGNDTEVGATTIPLVLTVTDIRPSSAPLYISVQTKDDYRSMKGAGAIIKAPDAATLTRTIQLPKEGRYAVSLWHDLDEDGRFTMNERYEIKDGWGSSGIIPIGSAPTFENAAIDVPVMGANATAAPIYPEE